MQINQYFLIFKLYVLRSTFYVLILNAQKSRQNIFRDYHNIGACGNIFILLGKFGDFSAQ